MIQLVIIKNDFPKDVGKDVVGAQLKTIGEVWAELDKKYGNPLSIADGVHKNIDEQTTKTLKRERVPKLHSLLRNASRTLETVGQTELVRSAEAVRH